MEKKLEKNFLLETRYENDKNSMKFFLYLSIIMPIYLIVYFAIILTWKKHYQEISQMRDEEREIELLNIIHTKRIKNQKYIYTYYALVDLGNKQVKDILIEKIIRKDRYPFSTINYGNSITAYGVLLAYIEKKEKEEKWGK